MTLSSIWTGYKLLPVNIFLQDECKKKGSRNTGAFDRSLRKALRRGGEVVGFVTNLYRKLRDRRYKLY